MTKYRVVQNILVQYGYSYQYKVQRRFPILGFVTIKTFKNSADSKERAIEYFKIKLKSKQERIECIGERV